MKGQDSEPEVARTLLSKNRAIWREGWEAAGLTALITSLESLTYGERALGQVWNMKSHLEHFGQVVERGAAYLARSARGN